MLAALTLLYIQATLLRAGDLAVSMIVQELKAAQVVLCTPSRSQLTGVGRNVQGKWWYGAEGCRHKEEILRVVSKDELKRPGEAELS